MIAPEPIALSTLSDAQSEAVRQLVLDTPGATDNPPLSERALLHLRSGEPVRHLVVERAGSLIGYAQLEPDDDRVSVELVTGDRSVAADLLRTAVKSATAPVRIWAHGPDSPVNDVAKQVGLEVTRRLFQLRRSLSHSADTAELASVAPPADVVIRPFVPGQDDARWLAVNARAFHDHPEQGSWTQRDLDDRLRSEWFDAAGFLLAERSGSLLGYHWTKVHSDAHDAAGLPLGEVYVLGVDPAAQGLGLGSVLLREGLRYLADRGLRTVLLYVDESNDRAVQLYRKLGFETFATDVQWGAPAGNPPGE